MDPFDWLDSIFGGSGSSGYTVQGGAPTNQGFAAFIGWANSQAFNGAGPFGQYFGMVFGSPGSGIPTVTDVTRVVDVSSPFDQRGGDWGTYQRSDFVAVTPQQSFSEGGSYGNTQTENLSSTTEQPPADTRTLEVLDREPGSTPVMPAGPIDEVFVIGSPRVQATPRSLWPLFDPGVALQRREPVRDGQEIQLNIDLPLPVRPKPRRPATRKPSSADTVAPAEPKPEREQIDTGPYFNVDQAPSTVNGPRSQGIPWMSDVPVSEQFLPFGSWSRPENIAPPRLEMQDTSRGSADRIASLPNVPMDRSFWNRGGTGLAVGALTASIGIAAVMWWNPVGWAAIGAALAIAAGGAATIASGVEVSASYYGATTPEQDARMNEAVSATLGYSSPGGVIGSVLGTVMADDPQQGYQQGAMWGGLFEGAASLPGTLRAVPGIWSAAQPWAKSLLLSPFWFFVSAGGGGGRSTRSLARVFAAQGRIASRVRQVEYLGTTPLLVRNADWARYQVFATRSSNESAFLITYRNGGQRIVLADRWQQTNRLFVEAKFGNMGQMYIPAREAHIMRQVQNYLDIATVTGGRVRYVVSTELGASRLTERFGLDFPEAMASDMLTVDWVQWPR